MNKTLKKTYYDTETNQHYFMDYSKVAKTTVLFTAPAYYNAEDDEDVVDFAEKVEVQYYLLDNNYSDNMGTQILSPTALKRLIRKCTAVAHSSVSLALKDNKELADSIAFEQAFFQGLIADES